MTEQTGRRRLFAAQQGQPDDRDKDRDTKNYRAIHLEILLQVYLNERVRKLPQQLPSNVLFPTVTALGWAEFS